MQQIDNEQGMDEFEKEVREAIAKIESTLDYYKLYEQGELPWKLQRKYDLNELAWLQAITYTILNRPMPKFFEVYVKPIMCT